MTITLVTTHNSQTSKLPIRVTKSSTVSCSSSSTIVHCSAAEVSSLPSTGSITSTINMAEPRGRPHNSPPAQTPTSPVDPSKEMTEVIAKLKDSSLPAELTSFLDLFQKGVNDCIEFFKQKVTDPQSGLEQKVSDLCTDVTSLQSRVSVLEKGPSVPATKQGTSASVSSVNTLISRINDLDKRLTETEFNTQILTCWADNMYQTTQSLQKQVDFHSSQQHFNEIIIVGIIEQRNQSCWEATKQFLAAKLNIQVADGDIYSARRIGKHGKVLEVQHTKEDG